MRKATLRYLFSFVAFFAIIAGANGQTSSDVKYMRVADVSLLRDGDEVVVASAAHGVAMSRFQKLKYAVPCSVDIADDGMMLTCPSDSVAVFRLTKYSGGWRLHNEQNGWLYAPNASSSDIAYSKSKSEKGSLVEFAFTSEADALLAFSVSNYKYLKYRNQTQRFARYQYASSNDAVQLYRRLVNPTVIDNLTIGEEGGVGDMALSCQDAFVSNVCIDRSFSADGGYYTVCLPFDLTENDINTTFGGAQFKRLSSVEKVGDNKLVLHFLTVRSTSAGVPYLLKLNAATSQDVVLPIVARKFISAAAPSEVSVKASEQIVSFVGTYDPVAIPADGRYRFVSADGSRFVTPASEGMLKGLRAYVVMPSPCANVDFDSAAKKLVVAVADDGVELSPAETTAVGALLLPSQGRQSPVYNLSGQHVGYDVKSLAPGVYVSGGRKIVIRK